MNHLTKGDRTAITVLKINPSDDLKKILEELENPDVNLEDFGSTARKNQRYL